MDKNHDLTCSACNSQVIKSYDSEVKLRAKLIKWTRDGMFAVCKSCNGEIPISADILKSIETQFSYEILDESSSCNTTKPV